MPASSSNPWPALPLPGPDGEAKIELLRLLADHAVRGTNWYVPSDDRFAALIARIASNDVPWLLRCIGWLRNTRNLAPAGIVASAEVVRFRVRNGDTGNRRIISMVLRSPDEPGALLGYWVTQHGRLIPKPVQRGVADAVRKLYTERAVEEFDRPGRGLSFADVLSIARPRPNSPQQAALFRQLVTNRIPGAAPTFSAAASPADPALGSILHAAVARVSLPR